MTWLFRCFLLSLLSLACSGGGGAGGPSESLLAGKTPSVTRSVDHPERLTDGVAAADGDHWETSLTTVFQNRTASVEYDLGTSRKIKAVYLQGDNNDRFDVWVADDSKKFRKVWTADTEGGAGMRERYTSDLDADARFVRVTARGGDRAVSLTELQVYEAVPAVFPPDLPKEKGKKPGAEGNDPLLWFTALTALALLGHRKEWPLAVKGAVVLTTVLLGAYALHAVLLNYPAREEQINLLRAVAATVAAAGALRAALAPASMLGWFVKGHLAAMALLAVASFYNLLYPQFEDAAHDGHTYVHTWDMRVYYPTAKYFDELGFDGLYVGSVKAYAEDVPNSLPSRIAGVELRDLRNYHMTRVSEVLDEIEAVKDRFTPERWEEFRKDMAYFRETMGSGGYLGSLRDHGGNATPAWLLVANLMFRWTNANEVTLLLAAALDPLLLLLFFGVAWRTFGLVPALVCVVVYGTTTFPMFGSNWGGSTLRNDWMVLLGLGVCALKSRRYFLGGVLLAGGAMIRAFPAFAVFALPLPALWWLAERYRETKKWPSLREIREAQAPLFRTLAGVLVCVTTLTLASGAMFGFQRSWGDWAHKISMHSVKPNVNHVGLRTVVAFDSDKTLNALHRSGGGDWSREQVKTLRKRMPIYVAAIAAFTALAVAAARRRGLDKAALLGLMMIPVWLYPSNYYLHYVFVLPLLVELNGQSKQRVLFAFVSAVLLAMSVAQYFGFETTATDERYAVWSYPALIGYALILIVLARESLELDRRSEDESDERQLAASSPAS